MGSIVAKARCIALPTAANRKFLQENLAESSDFWGPISLAMVYSFIIVWGQFRSFNSAHLIHLSLSPAFLQGHSVGPLGVVRGLYSRLCFEPELWG